MVKFILFLATLFAFVNSKAQPIFNWNNSIGSSQNEKIVSFAIDNNSDVVVLGTFIGTVDFDPSQVANTLTTNSPLIEEIFVAKYNALGALIWVRQISSSVEIVPKEIKIDHWNGIVYCGSFKGTVDFDPTSGIYSKNSNGGYDGFIAKLRNDGTYDYQNGWVRIYGSTTDDNVSSIFMVDNNQNFYAVGTFSGSVNFGAYQNPQYFLTSTAPKSIFICKVQGNIGNTIVTATIAGTNALTCDKVVMDNNYNIYIVGKYNTTVDFDPFIETDPGFASADTLYHLPLSTGGFQLSNYLVKVNASFLTSGYANDFSTVNKINSLACDPAGNTYISGTFSGTSDFDPSAATFNLSATDSNDIFIAKYNVAGNLVWAKKIGGSSNEKDQKISLDEQSNIYLTGSFSGSNVDFDPSTSAQFYLNSNGANDVFIAKYSNDGAFEWAYGLGGALNDEGIDIVYKLNKLYFVGNYNSANVEFSLSANNSSISSSNGGADFFISKYMFCDMINPNIDIQTLYLNSQFTGAYYQWLDCGNNFAILNGETNQFFQPTASSGNGPWAVEINYQGCIDTSYCATLLSVNVNEQIMHNYQLLVKTNAETYSIPFEIAEHVNGTIKLELFDLLGNQIIINKQCLLEDKSNSINIDFSNLNTGIYFVKIAIGNNSKVKKIYIHK